MSELGIVIVHYHAEVLLARCLRRLRGSIFDDFQVVVVDNGSHGDLSEVESDERFRLLRSDENLGFAAASNRGLALLSGAPPLLLSLNPDVLVEPETLGKMVEVMRGDPSLGAATCRLLLPSGRLDPACRRAEPTLWSAFCKQAGLSRLAPGGRFLAAYNLGHLDSDAAHFIDAGTGAFLLIRRRALEAAGGGFDERFFLYGEDLDLCHRLRRSGFRLLYWPGVRAVHHKGSGRIRSARATVHFYRAMWLYYRKWGRFRTNPGVLLPLSAALCGLCLLELTRNELARRFRPSPRSGE